jgi:hypothetical protein
MQQALQLAQRGLGHTYPNPAVGCVIVKDGKVGLLAGPRILCMFASVLLSMHVLKCGSGQS